MHVDVAKIGEMGESEAAALGHLARIRKGRMMTHDSVIPSGMPDAGDVMFTWRILNGNEKQGVLGAALARFKELNIPPEFRSCQDIEDEVFWQVLAVAMRDPDDIEKPLAKDVNELRENMTEDERDYLANQYYELEEAANPNPETMTPEKFKGIEEAIKKKDSTQLSAFGSSMLSNYILTGAHQQSI